MVLMFPGLTCGVDEIPAHPAYPRPESEQDLFPTTLVERGTCYEAPATTLRERQWQEIMNHITDKPDWEVKVYQRTIPSRWKKEAIEHGQATAWGFSDQMADAMIEELKQKADDYAKTGWIVALDPGVVKSDTAVPEDLKTALQEAVKPLENVSDSAKDWHPGSNNKVLDLVHPSLWPLMYGYTKILDPELICEIENCIDDIGIGTKLPTITADINWAYSKHFQWLPANLVYKEDGTPRFETYINNLHPEKHQGLYHIIEKIIDAAIPLWGRTLGSWPVQQRIIYDNVEYNELPEIPRLPNESEDDYGDRREDELWELRPDYVKQPEPHGNEIKYESIDLKKKFHAGLQVIVKLANIHLKPGESYDGGTWHVEGQGNERIVSTALYYYDSQNISESKLAFRQSSAEDEFEWGSSLHKEFNYEQSEHAFLRAVYGLENDAPTVHDIGSIVCREGRLITFPNTLQHRVLPFELEDKTKPGHRKILALFLVDPHIHIISTAEVPPQQKDWWVERVMNTESTLTRRLPPEIVLHILSYVDDPMPLEMAKQKRLELMEERSAYVKEQDEKFAEASYSLCEH